MTDPNSESHTAGPDEKTTVLPETAVALVEMERRGIVRREKNVGATVRFFSAEEIRQIYEVREMLTRQAALMIPLPAPSSLIEQLTELQRRYCEKADAQDPRVLNARDVLRLATVGGARALGLPADLGALEVGRLADFFLFDPFRLKSVPMHEPISTLVYAGEQSNVDTVVIDGKVVLEDCRFATIDEIGALTVFLCGPGGTSITGAALPVDGGWTAH